MNVRLAALLIWLGLLAGAAAQQSSIEVRLPSDKLISAAPGQVVTLSVVVGNRGEGDEVSEQLSLPPKWEKVAPPDIPFGLAPGGQVVRVLAILVPANMASGLYSLRYLAQSRRDPSSSGLAQFEVQVTTVDGLELSIEPQSGPILAGDEYSIRLRAVNHGNSRVAAKVTQRSSLGFAILMEQPDFDLDAGAEREIVCRVRTNKEFGKHASHAVNFVLTGASPSGKPLTASQASVVEIIPRIAGGIDPYHRLPMQQRLIGIAASGQEAMVQMELSGDGSWMRPGSIASISYSAVRTCNALPSLVSGTSTASVTTASTGM